MYDNMMFSAHCFISVSILLLYCVLCQAQPSIEDQIDEFVEAVLTCMNIPGLSLAVVRDSQDFISKGYGLANIDTGETVTNNTLFNINSVTKAFAGVSAAIAIKNDGSFEWNTPVRDIVGDWFFMNDSTRTQQVTLVDALSHRVGIPANNVMRQAGYDLRTLVEKLQYLDYTADFRHLYKYNNLMYSLPMIVIEETQGQSWVDYVRENIFQPLSMDATGFILDEELLPELAQGYSPDGLTGELRPVSFDASITYYESVTASGGIISNAVDMTKWIKFQLNEGTSDDGTEILTPLEFQATHQKHNQILGSGVIRRPFYPVSYTPVSTYSLGWIESTYRDFLLQQHSGSLNSFDSLLMLLPDVNHGVFLSANRLLADYSLNYIGMYVLDLLLDEEPWLNPDTVCDLLNPDIELKSPAKEVLQDDGTQSTQEESQIQKEIAKESDTTVLPQYIGTYGHYAYGNLTIAEGTSTPYIMVYGLDERIYDMEPSGGEDVFIAVGREPFWYLSFVVSFEKNAGEDATSLTVTFDLENPPRFERDLDWNNPPPPPELCTSLASVSNKMCT